MQNTGPARLGRPGNQHSGGRYDFEQTQHPGGGSRRSRRNRIRRSGFRAGHARRGAARHRPAAGPGFYRYKIGDIEATAINDGVWMRPLADGFVKNAALDEVKKAQEQAFLPTDVTPIPFTTTVLKTGGKIVLIDTGNGNSGAPTSGTWMANFKAAGFDPAQVDTIIISHFHGDHINGMRLKDGSAVFPKAEVMVSAPEWGFWMDDGKMAAAPEGLKGNFNNVRRVFGPMAKDVKQYEAGKELAPGVTAVAAPGHTPGHTAYVVSSGGGKLILMSDTTNHRRCSCATPNGRRCSTWTATRPSTRVGSSSTWPRRSAPGSRSTTRPFRRRALSRRAAAATSSCRCNGCRRSDRHPDLTSATGAKAPVFLRSGASWRSAGSGRRKPPGPCYASPR